MSDRKEVPATVRQRLFLCRKRIDKSPGLLAVIESVLGTVVFAHVLAATAMLEFDTSKGHLSDATLPIGVFCFEVTALSLVILVFVIKDVCVHPEESVSVWQREALGRLLRNIVVGSLLGVSLVWIYAQEELSRAVVPALVAACLGATKVVLIRTERTWFWLGVSVLFFLQLLLLIVKTELQLSWLCACLPLYLLSIDVVFLLFTLISEDIEHAKSSLLFILLLGFVKALASAMVLVTTLLCALHADGAGIAADTMKISVLATFCLCYVSAVRVSGAYILNIIWGHVDVDFLHQQYPALLARRQTV
jgi:hypothetical protein